MTHLNDIINKTITSVPGLVIAEQFERNNTLVWYVLGNTVKPDQIFVKRILSSAQKGTQQDFDEFYEKGQYPHPLLRISADIFSKLGAGKSDHDDTITTHLPYNLGLRISFGEIRGVVDTSGRPQSGSEKPMFFKIYFAPNPALFKEMDPKITDPLNQSYHFYPTDLLRAKTNVRDIPRRIFPSQVQFMYDRVWF